MENVTKTHKQHHQFLIQILQLLPTCADCATCEATVPQPPIPPTPTYIYREYEDCEDNTTKQVFRLVGWYGVTFPGFIKSNVSGTSICYHNPSPDPPLLPFNK